MTATPFGPRPPAEVPAQPVGPAPEPVPQQTPAHQPESGPIRSLTPTPPTADPAEPDAIDPSIILNPVPMALDDPATATTPSTEADAWWDAPLETGKSQSMLAPMLMSMGVLLGIFMVMRALRRRHANRPATPPPVDRISAIHERAVGSIGPIERAMADGEQLARRLAATMDNKAARIELLIEEADRKLEELNRAVAAVSKATPASPERSSRTLRSIDPVLLDRARVEQDRAERHGTPPRVEEVHRPEPTPSFSHGQSNGANPPMQPPATDTPADPVHRRVWALADDGMPSMEIARSLNQPVGQVELILNLRKSG